MEHEDTWGSHDDRRAWAPIVAVTALIAVTFGAVFLAFRDDGAAESGASLPSLALRPTTTTSTTTTTTTAPPATLAPAVDPPVLPPSARPDELDGSDDSVRAPADDPGSSQPRPELRELADELRASEVSDIVPVGSDRFAILVRSGDAELYRWSGSEWDRDRVVDAPAPVSDVATVDVTGDGIADFVITLGGLRSPGGVLARRPFGFELLPFNTNSGQVEWVDDLHLTLGRLRSDVNDNGNRIGVRWTWTGGQFEVLG